MWVFFIWKCKKLSKLISTISIIVPEQVSILILFPLIPNLFPFKHFFSHFALYGMLYVYICVQEVKCGNFEVENSVWHLHSKQVSKKV